MRTTLGYIRKLICEAKPKKAHDISKEMVAGSVWICQRPLFHVTSYRASDHSPPYDESVPMLSEIDNWALKQRPPSHEFDRRFKPNTTYAIIGREQVSWKVYTPDYMDWDEKLHRYGRKLEHVTEECIIVSAPDDSRWALDPRMPNDIWLTPEDIATHKDKSNEVRFDQSDFIALGLKPNSSKRQMTTGAFVYYDEMTGDSYKLDVNLLAQSADDADYVRSVSLHKEGWTGFNKRVSNVSLNQAYEWIVAHRHKRLFKYSGKSRVGEITQDQWTMFKQAAPHGDALDFAKWMNTVGKETGLSDGERKRFADQTGYERITNVTDAEDAFKAIKHDDQLSGLMVDAIEGASAFERFDR